MKALGRKKFFGSASDRSTSGVRSIGYDSFSDVRDAAHRHLMKTDVGYAKSQTKWRRAEAERLALRDAERWEA